MNLSQAEAALTCTLGSNSLRQQCAQLKAIKLQLKTTSAQVCAFRTTIVSEDRKMRMEQQCLAVLVDPVCALKTSTAHYYLTSAHCSQKEMIADEAKHDATFKWYPGKTNLECFIDGKTVSLPVAKMESHEKFGDEIQYIKKKFLSQREKKSFDEKNPGLNDIAIGKMERPFNVKPFCLDNRTPAAIMHDSSNCEIHKQGRDKPVPSRVNSISEPEIGLDVLYSTDPTTIVSGDSGGPLICIQAGRRVISRINSSELMSKTRIQLVYPLQKWISDTSKELQEAP